MAVRKIDAARACAVLAAIVVASGCGAPATPAAVIGPDGVEIPIRFALAPGSIVEITPVTITGTRSIDQRTVDAMLHEALRQSRQLDFAAGVESCDAAWRLMTTLDGVARSLAVSLIAADQRSLPLSSAGFTDQSLDQAIDQLARNTRAALGDLGEAAPIAVIYSREPGCVNATDAAVLELARGRAAEAIKLLERARRLDSGSTVTLGALAAANLETGKADAAVRLANDTLIHLESRLAPTTKLRLARTLLLGRAAQASRVDARNLDTKLLELGDASVADRPNDPHAHFTRALALNYLQRFDEAAPVLRMLRSRWPRVGGVAYQLAFAELARGRATAALEVLDAAESAIPRERRLLPQSLALYHADRIDRLREELSDALEDARHDRAPGKVHELLRMLASLELLTQNPERAAQHLLADLDWLRHHASMLPQLGADIAEAGEVLARIGHARDLGIAIEALQEVAVIAPTVSLALTYLAGLVLVVETDQAPTTALATLNHEQRFVWATLLRAAGHRRRGELVEEASELATAIRISDRALVRAEFARALVELGQTDQAEQVITGLRTRLLSYDLRRPLDHPLLSPGRALAYLAIEGS